MRELYKSHAHPLTRIVHGLPTSWDPSITVKKPDYVYAAAWSPCSRFIAVGYDTLIEILDAATLDRHAIFNFPSESIRVLIFSPDCRLLTLASCREMGTHLINWDIQTGAPVSVISGLEISDPQHLSLAFSACGTVLGVLFSSSDTSTIHIYNVLSGTHMRSHSVGSGLCRIWAHGERLRFATFGPGSITTWEAGFTSEHPLTEIESLPAPNDLNPSDEFLLLPTHSRLAFVLEGAVLVWDTQHSKLLSSVDVGEPRRMSFSRDGRFFACGTNGPEVYLWKESPTGYVPHQKLVSSGGMVPSTPLFSPNGQSIFADGGFNLHLWRTTDPTTTFSIPAHAFQRTKPLILVFSPDKSLMATARQADNTTTVFDLKSCVPRLTIDTGIGIHGLRIAGNNLVVVGGRKIVTWNLPPGDHVLDARVDVNESVRTTMLDRPLNRDPVSPASISPDLNYIAIIELELPSDVSLNIYDMATGKHLTSLKSPPCWPWFTPDGCEVWCYRPDSVPKRWAIVRDSESGFHKLEDLGSTRHPQDGWPWEPFRNCEVTDDRWILSSSKKRLLWLPPYWESNSLFTVQDGRFLGFLDPAQSEVVVLEVPEE